MSNWMPFYMGDFLRDTLHLDASEKWGYTILMWHCWQHGSIKNDKILLKKVCQIPSKKLANILPFFIEKDGYLFHERVTEEKKKEERNKEKSKARTEAARLALEEKRRIEAELTNTVTDTVTMTVTDSPPPPPISSLRSDILDDDYRAREKTFFEKVQDATESAIPLQLSAVEGWKQQGLSEEIILSTITAVVAKKKLSIDPHPPNSMAYFKPAMAVALAAINEKLPEIKNADRIQKNANGYAGNVRQPTISERADAALRKWFEQEGLTPQATDTA